MMMSEDTMEPRDQHDAYRMAVETDLADDNRTAMGQVKGFFCRSFFVSFLSISNLKKKIFFTFIQIFSARLNRSGGCR